MNIGALVFLLATALGQHRPIMTLDPTALTPITAVAEAISDPAGSLRIAQVAAGGVDFIPARLLPQFEEGNTPRITWFRVYLRGANPWHSWALHYTYEITRVDLYIPTHHGYVVRSGGFDLAHKDAALVPGLLVIPRAAFRSQVAYVRVASVSDPRSITIETVAHALPTGLERRGLLGLFVGFYFTIAIFNFLMFLSLRDPSLLDYALVSALAGLDLIISFGIIWHLLPPITFLQRELIFNTVGMGYVVALASFSIRFLKVSLRDRFGRALILASTLVAVATIGVDFIQNEPLAFAVTLVANLAFYSALAVVGIRAQSAGMDTARYFIAAIACFIAGYAVNMSYRLLPYPELVVFAYDAGLIAGSLLLAVALAKQVQIAETQATRDGLTGVLNRRAFDDALDAATRRANRTTVDTRRAAN